MLKRLVFIAFSVYVLVMLAKANGDQSAKQEELDRINQEITAKQRQKDDLTVQANDFDRYMEKKAREMGYARPDELIFVE